MASLKTKQKKPTGTSTLIRSLSIAPDDAIILDRLAKDASDYLGWTVSGSAVVRALLRQAGGQNGQWAKEYLFTHIEEEIQSGTVWGKKK
jgi:hypothetical protein